MISRLQTELDTEQLIITDPYMIQYFIGEHYDVGERFLALVVFKTKQPVLVLNKLFSKPTSCECIHYDDTENPIPQVISLLDETKTLALDGHMSFKFVLPFINQGFTLINASPKLESLRRIKTSGEIEKMKASSLSNDAIMGKMREALKIGMSEIELAEYASKLHHEPMQTGTSFDPIVVFSENIADPHGIPSNRVLKEGDVVLIDMGGMLNGYASDMTRCFFTGSNPTLEKLYAIVLEANKAAINAIEIGKPISAVDKAARDVITQAGYGEYFIHRTGHGIGIECHENLDVSSNNDTLIESGMCFSIEPGIYIEGIGGIRIEDLVCVEHDKISVLNHYPKEFKEIQI